MFLKEITYTNWTTKEVITKKLSRITLVVGDNGSAKSHLIRSIFDNNSTHDGFNTYEIDDWGSSVSFLDNKNDALILTRVKPAINEGSWENWIELMGQIGFKWVPPYYFEDHRGTKFLSLQLSSGYGKMATILKWITNKESYITGERVNKNSLILINDFETNLDPTLQLPFLKILSDYMPENHQFIISTHSPFVASQFSDDDKIVL